MSSFLHQLANLVNLKIDFDYTMLHLKRAKFKCIILIDGQKVSWGIEKGKKKALALALPHAIRELAEKYPEECKILIHKSFKNEEKITTNA